MSKILKILALGLVATSFYAPASFAGTENSSFSQNNVIFEKPECPEGETWNEEKKACEKTEEAK